MTEENLSQMGDNRFVTRLPFSYAETARAVAAAVAAGAWQEVGTLAETPAAVGRPAAQYRLAEKQVELYGRSYRALVVHSSAHDNRRLKAIERQLRREAEALTALCSRQSRREYFCRADAEAEALRLQAQGGKLHRVETTVVETLRHPPGRIEALGAILLISLLVWNLIEQCLRHHVEQTGRPLPGWDRKDTLRPTTFMMTTKFAGLQIVRIGRIYRLAQPLRSDQAAYLRALGLTLDDLLPVTTGPP